MRRTCTLAATTLLLAGCGGAPEEPGNATAVSTNLSAGATNAVAAAPAPAAANRWGLQSSGEGTALALPGADGATTIRLDCPAGAHRLIVNVPAFRPIGSEERLSFGSGGTVEALVANPSGDARRGGVSAAGPAPENLAALLGGPVSASYGAQTSGPHPAPPPEQVRALVAACSARRSNGPPTGPAPADPAGPCMMQGTERLQVPRLRAIGTEPFWAASIEGRCVTYSHPENQAGTRVWTRYTATADGGLWTGALRGRAFELRTRRQPGCSDGMSDRTYPIAVELLVGGERRRGCAAPG